MRPNCSSCRPRSLDLLARHVGRVFERALGWGRRRRRPVKSPMISDRQVPGVLERRQARARHDGPPRVHRDGASDRARSLTRAAVRAGASAMRALAAPRARAARRGVAQERSKVVRHAIRGGYARAASAIAAVPCGASGPSGGPVHMGRRKPTAGSTRSDSLRASAAAAAGGAQARGADACAGCAAGRRGLLVLLAIVSAFFGFVTAVAQDAAQARPVRHGSPPAGAARRASGPRGKNGRVGQDRRRSLLRRARRASCSSRTRSTRTMRNAVVAIEDKRFFDHKGVDPDGHPARARQQVVERLRRRAARRSRSS